MSLETIDREGHPIHLWWRALAYWPWLFKEIVKSAWDVTRIVGTFHVVCVGWLLFRAESLELLVGPRAQVGLELAEDAATAAPGRQRGEVPRR